MKSGATPTFSVTRAEVAATGRRAYQPRRQSSAACARPRHGRTQRGAGAANRRGNAARSRRVTTDPDQRTTMELDFPNTEDVTDFVSVPAGTYLCEISDVRTGATRTGEERWSFRLVVRDGEF